jgi:hypothetical protein
MLFFISGSYSLLAMYSAHLESAEFPKMLTSELLVISFALPNEAMHRSKYFGVFYGSQKY